MATNLGQMVEKLAAEVSNLDKYFDVLIFGSFSMKIL